MRWMALILLFGAVLLPTAPTQQAKAQDDIPFFIANCLDGRQIIGHRLILEELVPGSAVRLTAIGQETYDPAIAILNNTDTADCTTNTPEASGNTVAVPSIGRVESNNFTAQTTAFANNAGMLDVIVGGFATQSGQYAVIIETTGIDTPGDQDVMRVQIPPSTYQEWVGVYMVGEGDTVDPYIQVYEEEFIGRPIDECDNAGTQSCPSMTTLVDRGALMDQRTYAGDDFDAGIMDVYTQSELIYTFRDASLTTTGDYAIIFTATAPGAVATSTHICDQVEIELRDSSPQYNPAYTLDNILDGDPDTFWVTGAAPLTSEGTRETNAFIVIGILEDRPINKIRINGSAQALDGIEQNSLRRFALRFPSPAGEELVTALEAEVTQQAGYQSFNFLPTEVEEFGLVLLDNYGGTLFVLVDIQICGVR